MTPLILSLGLGLFLVFAVLFVFLFSRVSPQSAMLDEVTQRTGRSRIGPETFEVGRLAERLAKPFTIFRGMFSREPDREIARRLALAGYRDPAHSDIFAGARLAVPALAGLFVALFVRQSVLFVFFLTVVAAFFAPEFWLAEAIRRRRKRIDRSLPDGLDLLSICMEAGLGLDQAIVRVGQELRASHPDLSAELLQINFEQRAGVPRIESWKAFADRVDLESLRSFVSMLMQTERFGTPVAMALSTFSDSLRTDRRQKAEQMGAKAAVKLIFPLVFFIFPLVFLVTIGPAFIGLVRNLGKLLE